MLVWVSVFTLLISGSFTQSLLPPISLKGGGLDLYNPLLIRTTEAKSWDEPGWTIGPNSVDIAITWDIPPDMRAGKIGNYVVLYHSVDKNGITSPVGQRYVEVYGIDLCATGKQNEFDYDYTKILNSPRFDRST